MRQTAKALKTFFSSFTIPAYAETSVPDDVNLPYITYPVKAPEWREKTTIYCVLWYRSNGYARALQIADAIMQAVSEGVRIKTDNGYVVLYPDNPFIQEMTGNNETETDNETKGFYINMSINSFHVAGV